MRTYPFCGLMALIFSGVLFSISVAFAASVKPMSHEERAAIAGAVCRGVVETLTPYRSDEGFIYTKVAIRVEETFKGKVPSRLTIHYRGGALGNEGETVIGMPDMNLGDERLFFLSQEDEGRIVAVGGPAGAPRVNASGMQVWKSADAPGILAAMRALFPSPAEGIDLREFESTSAESSLETQPHPIESAAGEEGLFSPPRRSTIPDRGEPIRYLVDADELPPGISETEALEALENALAAWSGASSAEFQFDGMASFGAAANNVDISDGRLRIQLHDSYGAVGGSTLGIGGHSYTWISEFDDGGSGGTIDGIGFHRVTRSYVVLNHSASSMQNLRIFEATLCHEIGHALGLAHSSENPDETDPYLREAIMYYMSHGDDRGATLGKWDEDVIELVHPATTPPPFGFNRYLRVVTTHDSLENPEVNQVHLRGHSLHAEELTVDLYFPSSNIGEFTLVESVLTYDPGGAYSDSDELDPEGSSYWDRVFARFGDGANQSPPVEIRVIQLLQDSEGNGLPDSWAEEHFGSASPVEGVSGPHDDPDGDGFTNLEEFLLGTDPVDPNSRFTISEIDSESVRFRARPHDVYELYTSPDLETWQPTGQVVQPTSSTGEILVPSSEDARRFHRVERTP